ncbi:MAG: hypothetical protein NVS3B21_27960 [Acidimicrobiales bacterium]
MLPISPIVDFGCSRSLSLAERAAHHAPFPDSSYKAGARAFPQLVPTSPIDPAAEANLKAWAELGQWHNPFLTLFGASDPILGTFDRPLRDHVPGSQGQPHARLKGSHFVQEDAGVEIADRTLARIAGAQASSAKK